MLEIEDLTKWYGAVVANDGVSFAVRPGRIVGFVGPNGAGKSTTMRSVMGLVAYDRGSITWNGQPMSPELRRTIGYLPEQRGLYPKMAVGDQIVYFGRLRGLDRAEARRRAAGLLDDLGLADRIADPLQKLSHGNQQRVQLAVALVTDPKLLILDEPFNGLDPVAAETLHDVLRDRVATGTAVLFSSHQLELVERVCDDLVVIAAGSIRAAGSIDEVRASRGERRVVVRVARPIMPLADALAGLPVTAHTTTTATVAVDDDRELEQVLDRVRKAGPIDELRYELPGLTELFADLVEAPSPSPSPSPTPSPIFVPVPGGGRAMSGALEPPEAERRSTRAVALVAERELRTLLFSPSFLVGVGITALLVVVSFAVTRLFPDDPLRVGLSGSNPPAALDILRAVVDDRDDQLAMVELDLDPEATDGQVATVLESEDLDAVVIDGERLVVPGRDRATVELITGSWRQAGLVEELRRAGLDEPAIGGVLDPLTVTELEPRHDEESQEITGVAAGLILFLAIQLGGAYIMMGIMEEKGTKIVELLLSSIHPRDLLVGKVVGIGTLGIVQLVVLVVTTLVAATLFGVSIPALSVPMVGAGLAWFVVGYLLYGSLFAAGASLSPRQEDAQATLAPVSVATMTSFFIATTLSAVGGTSSIWSLVAYVPTVAPFAFPGLIASGQVAWWEVGLAFAIAVASTMVVFSMAARVYVRSVLHTDRTIGWLEAWRS